MVAFSIPLISWCLKVSRISSDHCEVNGKPDSPLSKFPFRSFARPLPFFLELPCFTFSRRSSLSSMTAGCNARPPGWSQVRRLMYPVPCCCESTLHFCARKAFTCSGVSNPSRACSVVPSLEQITVVFVELAPTLKPCCLNCSVLTFNHECDVSLFSILGGVQV